MSTLSELVQEMVEIFDCRLDMLKESGLEHMPVSAMEFEHFKKVILRLSDQHGSLQARIDNAEEHWLVRDESTFVRHVEHRKEIAEKLIKDGFDVEPVHILRDESEG